MIEPEFAIHDDFPPARYDQWRELAEATLNGAPFEKKLVTRTYEGIDYQPVYTSADFPHDGDPSGFPGSPPFVRGTRAAGAALTGFDLRQEHATSDLNEANQAVLEDLAGGVTSLLIVLDRAARAGLDPDDERAVELAGRNGLSAYTVDDLDVALADVDLSSIGVAIEGGAAFLPAAALLVGLFKRRDIAPECARGAFNADPIAVLAREGELPCSLETALKQASDLAKWTNENYPQVTAIGVDTSPYHHAGATAVQDLAFAMATGVEYLREMTGGGVSVDDAAKQILFRISVGTHHFLSIGKLRAGRRMWSRIINSCGGAQEAGAMRVHARLSDRVLTRHDPYVNLLRNTVGVFASAIGGAEAITSIPFDHASGRSDAFSRRAARNVGLILQEEAHFNRVIDPAGGSWFLERITCDLAEAAWELFQEVERRGGMSAALASGWIADQIASAYAMRAMDIASRKEGITGVSEFPNPGEQALEHSRPTDPKASREDAIRRVTSARKVSVKFARDADSVGDGAASAWTAAGAQAAENGATLGQIAAALGFHSALTRVAPLSPRPFAEPFEALRDACDAWESEHGERPAVFLVNFGPVAHFTARATYSKSFFEAGGFRVLTNDGFQETASAVEAFKQSGATVAVICSSDALYPDCVPELAPDLKAAGARTVVVAGRPGENEDAWRASGVDRFIFISCDVLGILREMLRSEGVLPS